MTQPSIKVFIKTLGTSGGEIRSCEQNFSPAKYADAFIKDKRDLEHELQQQPPKSSMILRKGLTPEVLQ